MKVEDIIKSLEAQAQDKEEYICELDPEDIFRQDVALREAARLLRELEAAK